MLAAALAVVGCTDNDPEPVDTAPVIDGQVLESPNVDDGVDPAMPGAEPMMDEPMVEEELNSEMTEGEVLTDEPM